MRPWTFVQLASVARTLEDHSNLFDGVGKELGVFTKSVTQRVDNASNRVDSQTRLFELWGSCGQVNRRQLNKVKNVVANDVFDGFVL
jgi:hypothetical protein